MEMGTEIRTAMVRVRLDGMEMGAGHRLLEVRQR
jgi:hypothetical protein